MGTISNRIRERLCPYGSFEVEEFHILEVLLMLVCLTMLGNKYRYFVDFFPICLGYIFSQKALNLIVICSSKR